MQDLYATSFAIASADPEATFQRVAEEVARWAWRGAGEPPELIGTGAAPRVGDYELLWAHHSVPDRSDRALEVTLRHPDPDVPERVWRTAIDLTYTDSLRFTARITRHAVELRLVPATIGRLRRPGVVPALLNGFSCAAGDLDLVATCPSIHVSAIEEFVESILKARARVLPVVVLAPFGIVQPPFDPARVADEVAGLAHVVQLGGHLAWGRFRELVGADFRVPSGGARIYWPGFGQPTDDLRHRFWTARWLSDSPQPLHRQLFELLARISVHAVPLDPSTRRLRELALQRHYEGLRESGRSAEELVEYLEDENQSLLTSNQKLEADLERLTGELETHRANYAAIAAATAAEAEAESPLDEADSSLDVSSWSEFVEYLPLLENEAFVLTTRAKEMCDPSPYPDPGRMWWHLERLAEAAEAWSAAGRVVGEGLKTWMLSTYGIEISLFDRERRYDFAYDGAAYSAEPHVKVDDYKDPGRCGRIYFAIDNDNGRFIVDHVGLHL
jgi:hypothetical protein